MAQLRSCHCSPQLDAFTRIFAKVFAIGVWEHMDHLVTTTATGYMSTHTALLLPMVDVQARGLEVFVERVVWSTEFKVGGRKGQGRARGVLVSGRGGAGEAQGRDRGVQVAGRGRADCGGTQCLGKARAA